MKRTLSPLLGTLSVLVFFALLGVTVYGVVQGQEEPEAAPWDSGPAGGDVDIMDMWLEEASVDCASGAPHLMIRARDPLPAGAKIWIQTYSGPIPSATGKRANSQPRGEPQYVWLTDPASTVEVMLSTGLRNEATEGNHVSVSVRHKRDDGPYVISNALSLEPSALRCAATP